MNNIFNKKINPTLLMLLYVVVMAVAVVTNIMSKELSFFGYLSIWVFTLFMIKHFIYDFKEDFLLNKSYEEVGKFKLILWVCFFIILIPVIWMIIVSGAFMSFGPG